MTRRRAASGALAMALAAAVPRRTLAATEATAASRVRATLPDLDAYIRRGLDAWHIPGAAVGITVGEEVVFTKFYGAREHGHPEPIGPATVFQIGSLTKSFTAAMLAILVDRGLARWDDRVVDHDPSFRMHDPWVTQEFRLHDLLAQRSGLKAHVLDEAWLFGFPPDVIAAGLRHVAPITSFRGAFAYINVTHLIAGRIIARRLGAAGWADALKQAILDPLGMTDTTATLAGLTEAAHHATGHVWFGGALSKPPVLPWFYDVGPAGALNATLTDMLVWLRMQTGRGAFQGKRIVQSASLTETWRPRIDMHGDAAGFPGTWTAYANGWIFMVTPGGRVIWHNGGTGLFRSHAGFLPTSNVGFVMLTNEGTNNLVDNAAVWFYDRLLINPEVDYSARDLQAARATQAKQAASRRPPAGAAPPAELSSYEGQYRSPILGDARVTAASDRLVVSIAAVPRNLILHPWNGDVFMLGSDDRHVAAVLAVGEPSFAGFMRDPGGQVSALRMSESEELTLTRVA